MPPPPLPNVAQKKCEPPAALPAMRCNMMASPKSPKGLFRLKVLATPVLNHLEHGMGGLEIIPKGVDKLEYYPRHITELNTDWNVNSKVSLISAGFGDAYWQCRAFRRSTVVSRLEARKSNSHCAMRIIMYS